MSLITMRDLATTGMGRFANQCFQVAFLNIFAEEHGCDLQHAPWVGEYLFGYPPKRVMNYALPVFTEGEDGDGYPAMPSPVDLVNHDFRGWGQHHTSFYARHRGRIMAMYRPLVERVAPLAGPVEQIRSRGRTLVGLHFRRGDYGQSIFYITPVEWYLRALAELWPGLTEPVLFIATEDKSLVKRFAAYDPVTAGDLGLSLATRLPHATYLRYDVQIGQLDFWPDFFLLSQCNVLLIPNSTFSFVAAMLAPDLQRCYRSDLPTQTFTPIDPWNAWPLARDRVEDYPGVAGIALDQHPDW